MAIAGLFSSTRSIYWPGEYSDIVNMLKGQASDGKPSHSGLYRYNTGPIILAAVIGLIHDREKDVGTQRQEISTDTFEAQRIGNSNLSSYVFLIPLIATQDLELLRPEREDELIRKFERFAAGGLEYLRGALSVSSDSTGISILKKEIVHALEAYEILAQGDDIRI
jgi:hypothetical protein